MLGSDYPNIDKIELLEFRLREISIDSDINKCMDLLLKRFDHHKHLIKYSRSAMISDELIFMGRFGRDGMKPLRQF